MIFLWSWGITRLNLESIAQCGSFPASQYAFLLKRDQWYLGMLRFEKQTFKTNKNGVIAQSGVDHGTITGVKTGNTFSMSRLRTVSSSRFPVWRYWEAPRLYLKIQLHWDMLLIWKGKKRLQACLQCFSKKGEREGGKEEEREKECEREKREWEFSSASALVFLPQSDMTINEL